MARVLLLSFPGYPSTPAALVANPWLADSAGLLVAQGHQVQALDFGTVSMMRRLYPEALTAQLKPLAARLAGGGGRPDETQRQMLQQVSDLLEAHQVAVTRQVAAEVTTLVQTWRPDLVALELGDGDGYEGSMAIVRQLRAARPELYLTVGGRKAAWFRALLLRANPELDSVIAGDPETALLALANRPPQAGGRYGLPGLIERDGAGTVETPAEVLSLDDLPLPLYDTAVYPAMQGDDKLHMVILSDSRGCPNRCAFCVHPYEDGAVLTSASPRKLADDMAALQARHGFSCFRLGGASTPAELLLGLAEEILRRGLRVSYNSFGHFRSARPEHFATLAQSGLYSLFYGLESGCQEILDRAVHKGIKLEQVRQTLQAARTAGIFTATSLIVPLPFDTPETLAESLRFVVDLRPDAVPLQFPGLFPGSRWIEHPERYQIEVGDIEEFLLSGLNYKMKLLFPPQFWEPLPYRVNGMSFREFTALTMGFTRDLEAAGLLTNFSHTLAAIARAAGMPPRQLRDLAMLWSVTGDAEAMGEMIRRANASMKLPPAPA